jgi:hypothetical protein
VSIRGKKMKKRVHVFGKSEIQAAFDFFEMHGLLHRKNSVCTLPYTRNFLLGLYIAMIRPCDDPTYLLLQVL